MPKIGVHYSRCKVAILGVVAIASLVLFFASCNVEYQELMTKEHTRFRSGFPSQANWVKSPYGVLKSYLFNVTNAEAFLNGTDSKLRIEEVGPIVYHVTGHNNVLAQTATSLTYQKIRYQDVKFDPVASCAPDILNRTLILPNLILLGAAAKMHDWHFFVRPAFNAITINEDVFLKRTVYYFLFEYTRPGLNLLSQYVPNIVSNCGMLYNALRPKEEVYNVQIGTDHGVENFFRVNNLNNKTFFPEHAARVKLLEGRDSDVYCPIGVRGSFDNSLFAPHGPHTKDITIIAAESCRSFRFKNHGPMRHNGFTANRFVVDDMNDPNCLNNAMGIPLHSGMFDVSPCLFNDVPAAFSLPHFYGSSYNWSEHFEGLTPNADDHDTSILIEPTTGIPIEVNYRFQSNMIMPDLTGYNKEIERFSNMVVPSFWYEYDLDVLPVIVLIMLGFQIYVVPVLQPICMVGFIVLAFYCMLRIYTMLTGVSWRLLQNRCMNARRSRKALQTTFGNEFVESAIPAHK